MFVDVIVQQQRQQQQQQKANTCVTDAKEKQLKRIKKTKHSVQ